MTWKDEIKKLWTDVGEASAIRNKTHVYNWKKGPEYRFRSGGATPGNTTIRELLSDERFSEAVLAFLRTTEVGCGALSKGG